MLLVQVCVTFQKLRKFDPQIIDFPKIIFENGVPLLHILFYQWFKSNNGVILFVYNLYKFIIIVLSSKIHKFLHSRFWWCVRKGGGVIIYLILISLDKIF